MNTARISRMVEGKSASVSPVERLENRLLLSWSAGLSNPSSLAIRGDQAGGTLAITDDGNGRISFRVDGQARPQSFTGISSVVVRAGGGNDQVSYKLTGDLRTSRRIDIDLGAGNDSLEVTASGRKIYSPLTMIGRGGSGNDILKYVFQDMIISSVIPMEQISLNMLGGDGNDEIRGEMTIAGGTPGAVAATLNGGSGNDHLVFKASPKLMPAAAKAAAGGAAASSEYYQLTAQVTGGTGNDDIEVDLDQAAGSQGRDSVKIDGGAGDDSISLNLDAQAGGSVADTHKKWIDILAYGGQGNDELSTELNIDPDVSGGIGLTLDGGAGDDSIILKVIDKATPSLAETPSNAGAAVGYFLTINVQGRQGNDAVDANVTLVPGGAEPNAVTISGGAGNDSLSLGLDVVGDQAATNPGHVNEIGLDGGQGDDDVRVELPIVPESPDSLHVALNGGTGDDNLILKASPKLAKVNAAPVPPPGTFAMDYLVKMDMNGGQGNDILSADVAVAPGLFKASPKLMLACSGSAGDDALAVNLSAQSPVHPSEFDIAPQVALDVLAGDGNDQVQADLAIAPNSLGSLDAALDGGAGDDTFTLRLLGDLSQVPQSSLVVGGGSGYNTYEGSATAEVTGMQDVLFT